MPPQFDIVEMWSFTDAEDAHKFVLTAIERTLPRVRLHPYSDINGIAINRLARCEQFGNVPPVDANEMNCALSRYRNGGLQGGAQESDVLGRGQLAACVGGAWLQELPGGR